MAMTYKFLSPPPTPPCASCFFICDSTFTLLENNVCLNAKCASFCFTLKSPAKAKPPISSLAELYPIKHAVKYHP